VDPGIGPAPLGQRGRAAQPRHVLAQRVHVAVPRALAGQPGRRAGHRRPVVADVLQLVQGQQPELGLQVPGLSLVRGPDEGAALPPAAGLHQAHVPEHGQRLAQGDRGHADTVLARLRRMSGSMYEASAGLGAHGWFAFRTVTVPMLSTALISGALLAFALSFDEVIVTTFTAGAQNTLPLWIFGAIRLGQQLPEVNVVVVGVLLLTVIPVVIAARLTGGGGVTRGSAAAAIPGG
jgi:hypothetical protein